MWRVAPETVLGFVRGLSLTGGPILGPLKQSLLNAAPRSSLFDV